MSYSSTVLVALLGWPVLMAALLVFMPIRRVVLVSIVGGNLFLPQAGLYFTGLPDYTKPLAAGLGALLATLLAATPQLLSWRPRKLDFFFLAFLIAPSISSLVNGLGPYDAASALSNRFLEWGVAYWVGRSVFDDQNAMRDLAVGFVVGGLVYTPFCVWESVMSPQLHRQIFGFRTSPWIMTMRFGGYRPTVFMQHGLAVALWMASTSAVAWVLWRSRSVLQICCIPIAWIAIGLFLVTISLRSAGAALLLIGVIVTFEFVQLSRLRLALLALLLIPAAYIGFRVAGWEGRELVNLAALAMGEGRAGSLNVRLENDTRIADLAMERPAFGWGGWGRWRVRDEFGNDITVSDSWWGILVGSTGVFGLVAAYGTFIAPMFLLIRQRTTERIFDCSGGAAWAVGMAIMVFVLDTLANAMPNTSFMLAAGAMVSFVTVARESGRSVEVPKGDRNDEVTTTQRVRRRSIDLR